VVRCRLWLTVSLGSIPSFCPQHLSISSFKQQYLELYLLYLMYFKSLSISFGLIIHAPVKYFIFHPSLFFSPLHWMSDDCILCYLLIKHLEIILIFCLQNNFCVQLFRSAHNSILHVESLCSLRESASVCAYCRYGGHVGNKEG
jgi:hypothetical protein